MLKSRLKSLLALAVLAIGAAAFLPAEADAAPCISSTVAKVTVKNNQSVCISAGANIGSVVVQQGGSLSVSGGTIGNFSSDGAASIQFTGGTVTDTNALIENTLGPLSIDSTTFTGSLTLTGNRVGVSVTNSSVGGVLKITNTLHAVTATGNTVTGNMTVKTNTQGITITGNTVGGDLTVTGNYGPPLVDSPNTVSGTSNVQ